MNSFYYRFIQLKSIVLLLCFSAAFFSGTAADDTASFVSDSLEIHPPDTTDTLSSKQNKIIDTVFYESELISYDNEEKILFLSGKAKVKYQKMELIADTIIYTINDNLLTAAGLPYLIEGKDTTFGDYMVYNIKTRRGRVRQASTHLTEGHFNGSRIIKTEDDMLYVDQGDYTTCERIDNPHYFFYGKKIKVIPEDKIISKPVVMNIGGAPVAVLPFFIFPLDRNRRSGFLTPVWGGHPTSGGYVENIGYYWAPNDYIDLLGRGKVHDFKEYVIEATSQYRLKYKFNGFLNARYALNSNFHSENQNWAIKYSHDQSLTPDGLTKLAGSGSLVKTSTFYRNNSEDINELKEPTITANMSLSKTFENINARSAVTWRRTHNFETEIIDEDLPSVTFSLPSRPLIKAPDSLTGDKAPWYSKFYYEYNSKGIIKHIDSTSNGGEQFRPGATHSLSLLSPQKLFTYITVNPGFNASQYFVYGYRDTAIERYDTLIDSKTYMRKPPFGTDNMYPDYTLDTIYDTLSQDQYGNPDSIEVTKRRETIIARHKTYNDFYHIEDWNANVGLSTTLYGIFPIKILRLNGIRHTLSPSVSYKYSPKRDVDKLFYPTGVTPPGPQKKSQVVSLQIGNKFEGKLITPDKTGKQSEKSFTLFSLNLSTSYDFEKESRRWNDLSISASSSVEKIGLILNYRSTFWLYDQTNHPIIPMIYSLGLDIKSSALRAKGSLWNGDLFDLESLIKPDTGKANTNAALDWNASLNPSFSFSMSRSSPTAMFIPKKTFSLSGSSSLNFTKSWSFQWNGTYNFERNQWVNNSINLNCDLECWNMRFNWRPEKLNPGYSFLINIKKIPEIKWEQKN